MDTVKDTKMQPVKDAVINTLRKVSVDCYWPTSPVTIKELLDHIEAAEKERDVLRDRLALESQENGALRDSVDRACEERNALRAKITEMEKQKPVAWTTKLALEYGASRLGFQVSGVNMWGENGVPLYTLPGAQPAPIIPEGWKPIPEKHPTFDLVDLRLADGSVLCGCVPQSDGDYWWNGPSREVFIDPKYASVTHWRLAAAPEAKSFRRAGKNRFRREEE